jgi:hypothetical protein
MRRSTYMTSLLHFCAVIQQLPSGGLQLSGLLNAKGAGSPGSIYLTQRQGSHRICFIVCMYVKGGFSIFPGFRPIRWAAAAAAAEKQNN